MTERTAALLVIGDEILSGRTEDKNINFIAKYLNDGGIELKEVRVIGDEKYEIIKSVNGLRKKYDYLFTTGGIGPTHDDITAEAVAKAFKVELRKNKKAFDIMEKYYFMSNIDFTQERQKMTMMPKGAKLIDNAVSVAPGFSIGNVYVMAGVPKIMQAMMKEIMPKLKTGKKIYEESIECKKPEGEIARKLGEIQKKYKEVSIGSYPKFTPEKEIKYSTEIVVRGTDEKQVNMVAGEIIKNL